MRAMPYYIIFLFLFLFLFLATITRHTEENNS